MKYYYIQFDKKLIKKFKNCYLSFLEDLFWQMEKPKDQAIFSQDL